jgi:hypothetical protein
MRDAGLMQAAQAIGEPAGQPNQWVPAERAVLFDHSAKGPPRDVSRGDVRGAGVGVGVAELGDMPSGNLPEDVHMVIEAHKWPKRPHGDGATAVVEAEVDNAEAALAHPGQQAERPEPAAALERHHICGHFSGHSGKLACLRPPQNTRLLHAAATGNG